MSTPNSAWPFVLLSGALLIFECCAPPAVRAEPQPPAGAGPAGTTAFDIPAGDATNTLMTLATQCHVDILYDPRVTRGVSTPSLSGVSTCIAALKRLLTDTDLEFALIGGDMIAVRRRELPPPAPVPRKIHAPALVSVSPSLAEVVVRPPPPEPPKSDGQPIAYFSSDDIERIDPPDLPSLLRTQSQVFGGGPSEDTVIGREAQTNALYGSGVNLRGLDAGATLFLVNGRRVAPSGSSGAFSDISNIPLSAVKSVEILADGAATPYGADAPGGVVNVTMRNDFVGSRFDGRFGAATYGAVQEHRYDGLWGTQLSGWEGGNLMLAVEYFDRDALQADERLQVVGNLVPLGGSNYNTPYGNPGNIVVDGQTFAIARAQNGAAPNYVAGPPNEYNPYQGTSILPGQERVSGLGSLRLKFSDLMDGFADTLITRRAVDAAKSAVVADLNVSSTNPYYVNPTGTKDDVTVEYGFLADLGPQALHGTVTTINAASGLNWNLQNWRFSAVLDYAAELEHQRTTGLVDFAALGLALEQSDPSQAFDPFGVGSHTTAQTLARISAYDQFDSDSHYYGGRFGADAVLLRTAAGDIRLGTGLEFRHQTLDEQYFESAPVQQMRLNLGRDIESAFGQLWIPLLSPEQHIKGVDSLEVKVAGRVDNYSNEGHAFAPTYTLDWSPLSRLSFRGTFSRSFRPPNLVDLSQINNQSLVYSLADKSALSGLSRALIWSGGNAQLVPESARNWTAGVTFRPSLNVDSSLALTFFDISVHNRFDQPALPLDALDDATFQDRVVRNPTPAQHAAACQSAFPGGVAACLAAPIDVIVDLRVRNLAALRTTGTDLLAKFEAPTRWGRFGGRLEGTYLFQYAQTPTPGSATTSLLNRQNEPIDLRFSSEAFWKYRNLRLATLLTYANHYRDWVTSRNIASWTTVDLTANYTIVPANPTFLSNVALSARVQNVFDRMPPFINNTLESLGYDQENGNLLGRFVSVSIRKEW